MTSSLKSILLARRVIDAKLIELRFKPKLSISLEVAFTPIIQSFNCPSFTFFPKTKAKS
jgi:hypothetical protein